MKLHELFDINEKFELDRYGIYGKPAPRRKSSDGSQSPLTYQGDASWKRAKNDIFNWFRRPYLTNGPRGNYRLPIKGKKS